LGSSAKVLCFFTPIATSEQTSCRFLPARVHPNRAQTVLKISAHCGAFRRNPNRQRAFEASIRTALPAPPQYLAMVGRRCGWQFGYVAQAICQLWPTCLFNVVRQDVVPRSFRCLASSHNALKSSGTSPNFRNTVASRKSPVAGSPVRLNATAPV
jgi:hypothetical protein